MAKVRIGGALGAIAVTGTNADFNRWSLNVTTNIDDDTCYSTTAQVVYSSHFGSGVLDFAFTGGGFLAANAASTAPNLAGAAGTPLVTAFVGAGAACTFTSKTSCTHTGAFVLSGGSVDHHVRAGAVPCSFSGIGTGTITESWATS